MVDSFLVGRSKTKINKSNNLATFNWILHQITAILGLINICQKFKCQHMQVVQKLVICIFDIFSSQSFNQMLMNFGPKQITN